MEILQQKQEELTQQHQLQDSTHRQEKNCQHKWEHERKLIDMARWELKDEHNQEQEQKTTVKVLSTYLIILFIVTSLNIFRQYC